MWTAFFDAKGTINLDAYITTLRRLHARVIRVRPELLDLLPAPRGTFLLHHDNTPAHSSHATAAYIAGAGIQIVNHPPYSPDLAPADFWLFPCLKTWLGGQSFDTDAELRAAVKSYCASLTPEQYGAAFTAWEC